MSISLKIIVKVYHLLDGLVKLALILEIEPLTSVLELTHLRLHLVEDESHLVLVQIMLLGDVDQALLKLLLILHIDYALVLEIIELFLVGFRLASVFLTHFLLLVKKVTPLGGDRFEILGDTLSILLHFLEELKWHLNALGVGLIVNHV